MVDLICRVSNVGVVVASYPDLASASNADGAAGLTGRRLAEWAGPSGAAAVDAAILRAVAQDASTSCEWGSDDNADGHWRADFVRTGPGDVVAYLHDVTRERCRDDAEHLVRSLQEQMLGGPGAPSHEDVLAALERVSRFVGGHDVTVVARDAVTAELHRPYEWNATGEPEPFPAFDARREGWLRHNLSVIDRPLILEADDLPDEAYVLQWVARQRDLVAIGLIRIVSHTAALGVVAVGFRTTPTKVARLRHEELGGLGALVSTVIERQRRDDEQRESALRLASLVEQTSELIAVIGADADIQYISPMGARLAGYRHDDYRSDTEPIEHVVPEDQAGVAQSFSDALARPGQPIEATFRTVAENGGVIAVEGTFTNLLHVPGVRGVVLNAHDVTAQRAATTELRTRAELDALIAAVSRELLVARPEGILGAVRDALARVSRHIGADFASLGLREADGWYRRVASWYDPLVGPPPADVPERVAPEQFPWALTSISSGHSGVLHRLDALPPEAERERETLERIGARSAALVPIRAGGGVTGYVSLFWREHDPDETAEILTPLRVVGDVLTVAYERARAADEARRAEARFRSLIEHARDGIVVFDASGVVVFASPAVEAIYGLRPDELIGMNGSDMWPPGAHTAASHVTARLVDHAGSIVPFEAPVQHRDGDWRWVEATVTNLLKDEAVGGYVLNVHDITDRKRFEGELEHQALHDSLTGLPNRALLVDRLEQALTRAQRAEHAVGLLFLDIDRFKYVNDGHGHAAGDEILRLVAGRLRSSVRPTDTVARFGGDEFVMLIEDGDTDALLAAAERIRLALRPAFVLAGVESFITASIGIAVSQPGRDDPDSLVRDADAAMYRAKDQGRDRYEVFDPSIHARALAHLETTDALHAALGEDHLRLHYQPIVRLDTGEILGFEALLRWQRPGQAASLPADLIAVAEDTGLIVPIGEWVIEEAGRQAAQWRGVAGVGINLSVRQLREPNLVDRLARVLRANGIGIPRMTVELTETVMADDIAATLEILHALKRLGVRIVVDDFGTGYSSLEYVKQLPVDALKIDRTFVAGLGEDPEDTAIVTAMVGLANGLDLEIVAEGVETKRQVDALLALGVYMGQGFYFGRPAPAEEWTVALERGVTV